MVFLVITFVGTHPHCSWILHCSENLSKKLHCSKFYLLHVDHWLYIYNLFIYKHLFIIGSVWPVFIVALTILIIGHLQRSYIVLGKTSISYSKPCRNATLTNVD